jgi:5'(3')-deoxyribonucleotidase
VDDEHALNAQLDSCVVAHLLLLWQEEQLIGCAWLDTLSLENACKLRAVPSPPATDRGFHVDQHDSKLTRGLTHQYKQYFITACTNLDMSIQNLDTYM